MSCLKFSKVVFGFVVTVALVNGVLLLNSDSMVVLAQTPIWSTPQIVSPEKLETEREKWFSEIVVDLNGNVHLFWTSSRMWPSNTHGGYDLVMHCRIENNDCSDVVEIIAIDWRAGINVTRPMAVVDSQNTIHLLVRGVTPGAALSQISYQQAPAEEAHRPQAWTNFQRLSSGRFGAAYSDIILDSKGTIHVVWSEDVSPLPPYKVDENGSFRNESGEPHPCGSCPDIFYRQSSNYGKVWSGIITHLTQLKI